MGVPPGLRPRPPGPLQHQGHWPDEARKKHTTKRYGELRYWLLILVVDYGCEIDYDCDIDIMIVIFDS